MITTPLKLTTSNTTSSSTGDTSPRDILKRHTSELLGIVSDPDKLAVDLWSADLIPDPVKDNVLTTVGLSRLQKSIKLVDEVYRSLEVFNSPDILIKFCDVLKIQQNPGLTRIADEMLKQFEVSVLFIIIIIIISIIIIIIIIIIIQENSDDMMTLIFSIYN